MTGRLAFGGSGFSVESDTLTTDTISAPTDLRILVGTFVPTYAALRPRYVRASRCQSLLDRPALKPPQHCGRRDAKTLPPISQTETLPTELVHLIAGSVPHLLVACGPHAILWRVAKRVVFALDTVAGWTRPHVRVKVLKDTPVLTYRNPATSVASIVPVVWISASLEHGMPRLVFRAIREAVSGAHFSSETATGPCATTTQVHGRHVGGPPAVTSAFPHASLLSGRCALQHDQSTEALSDKIKPVVWRAACRRATPRAILPAQPMAITFARAARARLAATLARFSAILGISQFVTPKVTLVRVLGDAVCVTQAR